MFYLVSLPFRIVFGLLFGLLMLPVALLLLPVSLLLIPFLLLKLVFRALFALAMLPFVFALSVFVVVAALAAASFAVVVPLLPFLFVAYCVWLLTRRSRAAIAVRG